MAGKQSFQILFHDVSKMPLVQFRPPHSSSTMTINLLHVAVVEKQGYSLHFHFPNKPSLPFHFSSLSKANVAYEKVMKAYRQCVLTPTPNSTCSKQQEASMGTGYLQGKTRASLD